MCTAVPFFQNLAHVEVFILLSLNNQVISGILPQESPKSGLVINFADLETGFLSEGKG